MADIINPCDRCTHYNDTMGSYLRMLASGDSDALRGQQTVIDMMLQEERDPEVDSLLKAYPDACPGNRLCIYRPGPLHEFKARVDRIVEAAKGVDKEERDILLRTAYEAAERSYATALWRAGAEASLAALSIALMGLPQNPGKDQI